MKKVISILMMLVLLMGLMVGCADDPAVETTTEKGTEAVVDLTGKKVVIGRWGGNDAETASFKAMIDGFKAKTGIEVEERVYSDYNTELQAELIGGSGPDVFYVDAYMAPFYTQQGVLMALDEATFQLDAFYPSLRDAFETEGKFYAVSKDYSTLALYYNKAYLDEADIPKTMEELLGGNFLVDLKATLPEGMVAMTYNQDLARALFMAEAGGASVIRDEIYSNLADPAVFNNLKLEYDAAKAGKIVQPSDLGMGWNGDAFGNEKTAIMIEGNWVLGHLNTNFPDVSYGVIEIPTFAGEKGTMVFTVGYGINSNTKSLDAATAFIQYATGTEGMATWTTGAGVLPSREDVAVATNIMDDMIKAPHIAGAAYATPWQKGTTMDTINAEFRNYVPAYIKGEKTLEEALMSAQEEANKTIEANN